MANDQSRLIDEVKSNVAFEQFIVSVLSGAGIGAVLYFVIHLGGGIFAGIPIVALILPTILQTVLFSFLVFLIGFFTSVIVIIPLFRALEKAKRRNVWPYVAAVVGVTILFFVVLSQLSQIALPDMTLMLIALVSALFIAFDFGRRMRPIWLATTHAEQTENKPFTMLH